MNRKKIEDTLLLIGIPTGILGFSYIADAIEIFRENGTEISITKKLYPEIAEKNNTTASRVERAIRHAFEVVRSYKGNPETVNRYIGFTNTENSSSLKMLYMRLKQECGEAEQKECAEETTGQENRIETTDLKIREIMRQELKIFLNELKESQI